MEIFVNREEELQFIHEKFSVLLGKNDVARAQIIEFYGVGGIGKTTMLRKLEQYCRDAHLTSIWANANQSIAELSHTIIQQAQQYKVQFMLAGNDHLIQSVNVTKALLAQGPVVIFVDSLEGATEEQRTWIEHMLRDLVEDDRLFAILASKRIVSFEHTMSVARRIIPFHLESFNRTSCLSYIDKVSNAIQPEIRDIIFEWTNGYPLALNVMTQAIHDYKLDPSKEPDRKQLLAILTEQVIKRGVLSNAVQTPTNLEWYQTMLCLFSVPRGCNLNLMEKLIEKYEPRYKYNSSLAYMTLPSRINQAADIFNWNRDKAGFSIEAPIRRIFLVKVKVEQPDRYKDMHRFLAQMNEQFAAEVPGVERVHYWQEYLYHSANCIEDNAKLQQIVEKTVKRIITESPESFLQFHEEFTRDEELKAALDTHSTMVVSLLYRHLASMNKQFAADSSKTERTFYLREFFYYRIYDPELTNILPVLRQNIQQMIKEEPVDVRQQLHDELMRDTRIVERLGEHISILSSLLRKDTGE